MSCTSLTQCTLIVTVGHIVDKFLKWQGPWVHSFRRGKEECGWSHSLRQLKPISKCLGSCGYVAYPFVHGIGAPKGSRECRVRIIPIYKPRDRLCCCAKICLKDVVSLAPIFRHEAMAWTYHKREANRSNVCVSTDKDCFLHVSILSRAALILHSYRLY